jgi:4,5-dihydroxyphthalate decarboxylase
MSLYLPAFDRGENCIAIPVFPLRDPVWGCAYVRSDSSLTHPRDLAGKRIGLSTFRGTFALWMRGLFKEHYGFSPEQATWSTGGPEPDGYVVPKGIRVEVGAGKTPLDKLKDGEVDCIWLPRVPKPFFEGEAWIRRLFPDAQGEMQRFVKRTGISAIGHTVVMNKGLVEREPWVAQSLFHAFVEAQKLADEVCQIEKVTSYLDSTFIVEQQRWAYGPNPYAHGLKGNNRKSVEAFARYAYEQNYISKPYAIEQLFAANTLEL